ncbi:MAG: putative inorganic carbon transporter subunit DabA [Isosphaerales bacterium]
MRDLRTGFDPARNGSRNTPPRGGLSDSLSELLGRYREPTIEDWTDDEWEGFTLQALWRVCCDGVRDLPAFTPPPAPAVRHRDLLLEATGKDTDTVVHERLIGFCSAFLDQGFTQWELPRRDEGFYHAFCAMYRQPGASPQRWMRRLAREAGRLEDEGIGPLDLIHESLVELGVTEPEWESFLSATLLALRGWGGMVQQIELRGDRVVRPVPEGSLTEFLAVRLLLDRFALASVPLVTRILFPRLTARVRHLFGHIVRTPPLTRLQFERTAPAPGPENGEVGFNVEEMTNAAERMLRDIGLTSGFARLVLLHGHGSDSLNNPHNSAYNCGACGGVAGGPNARTMASILNDPRVRAGLGLRGLRLPADTVFVGGYHNTCNDSVTYFDLDRIPPSHRGAFESARADVEATCDRNAHERCRRFMSVPLTMSFAAAREHVEERAEDLAQTRPELGHATNAITVVGRREWTRGLFLDRRAFLTSYDPTQDGPECPILTRILQAVFPVCAGINLEYYFVFEDGEFRPYRPRSSALRKAASSVEWYRGWRDHLEFAEIEG